MTASTTAEIAHKENFAALLDRSIDAKITAIDRAGRRVILSIKAREIDDEKRAMQEFGSSDSGASLGDILGAAIRRRQKD